jgi:hypothetical protein
MGKWDRNNELQEYLNDIKESQDHQYSKGYWLGKVPKYSSTTKVKKLGAGVLFFYGSSAIVGAGLILLPNFLEIEFLDWDSWGSFLIAVILLFLGLLFLWAGFRRLRGGKTRRELK